MKRFREVVFSATVPEDRNVIWIFPVTKDIDNDLKDDNLPVEDFKKPIYKVMIWELGEWVSLFHGSLLYIKAQLLSLLGDVPEGKTVIQVIGELENTVDLNIQEVQILNNALTVLEGIVSNKVDKVEGKGLSDENFTSIYKNLLDTLTGGYMTFKDIVDTLPESANNGDVYIVEQTSGEETQYLGYIWSDIQNTFLPLGNVTNFSNFYTKSETYSKQEVESKITNASIIQKYQPQGDAYKLYPMFVDPMADMASNVSLGGTYGVLNFHEMHEYFNIAFDTTGGFTNLSIGGNNNGAKHTGILSLYNRTKQAYTYLIGGEGDINKTYKLPSEATDGGKTILATIATATTARAGLMSPQDKNTLNNLVGGNIPIGGIIMWSGKENTIDTTHWAICNGQTVNGHTTPDLQGRFVLGSGIYTEEYRDIAYKPDETGGQIQIKLTSQQSGLPSHTHKIPDSYEAGKGLTGDDNRYYIKSNTMNTDTSSPYIGATRYDNGKDALQAHNNMPPYYVLAFIMRIA